MDLGLDKKVAIVTAASGGLGATIAEELAAEGATVVVSARNGDRLGSAVEAIKQRTDGDAHGVVADMTDADAVTRMVRQTEDRFGGIDVLLNNTGGAATAPFAEMRDDARLLWPFRRGNVEHGLGPFSSDFQREVQPRSRPAARVRVSGPELR